MVKTAVQQSVTRLKSAAAAIKDAPNTFKNKLIKDGREVKDLADSGLTKTRDFIGNLIPSRKMGFVSLKQQTTLVSCQMEGFPLKTANTHKRLLEGKV